MRRITVEVTTAADGSAVAYSPRVSGKVHQITYAKIDFADGVDFTITAEATGETLWTQSNVNAGATVAPRLATSDTAGAAALFATSGTAVRDAIGIANDRVKISIAQGGANKTGRFFILID